MNHRRLIAATCAILLARVAQADPTDPDAGAPDASAPDAAAPQAPAPQAPAPQAPAPQPPPSDPPPQPARPAPRNDPNTLVTPRVDVVGSAPRALDRVPGSATVVRREDLQQLAPQNAGDVLRTVPGVNVVSEDGMGLRLNIGIRGLSPNRSRQVLVLEDGLPVSLNPYGSPELYYSPPIERMERVEVVRGSGQILWGPQTLGGVINYITRDPPRAPSGGVDLRYGSYGYLLAQAWAGATHGSFGWRLDVIHRRFEGARRLDLALTDIALRTRIAITPRSILGIKLNFYDESSGANYLGLTTSQFAADPTLMAAPNDHFGVRRYALAVTHQHAVSGDLMLRTGLYAYQTDRVWRRQEFDRTGALMDSEYERVCDGRALCGAPGAPGVNVDRAGSSIFFLRRSAIRDRVFNVFGVEPRLTWTWTRGAVLSGELSAVVRFHAEDANEELRQSSITTVDAGVPTDAEVRNGYALAAAVQHRFGFWDKLFITPGVRVESFWSDRRVTRQTGLDAMGRTVSRDVDVRGSAHTVALIPGLGVAYSVVPALTIFTGVHRGYAPPRTKDAVSNTGLNLQLDPELSWNTELGVRARAGRWLNAEVAGFLIEFENQITPPSEAGGATAAGGFNSGHSRHAGVEVSAMFDVASLANGPGSSWALPLVVNYTWLPTATILTENNGIRDVTYGNRLPYAPEHTLFAQLRFVHRVGISAQVSLNYVSAQYADSANTEFPSADGLVGRIDGYAALGARVGYTHRPTGFTFYVAGNNLTNDIYVANRAPSGIQPGGFRQVFGGIEWTFPQPATPPRL